MDATLGMIIIWPIPWVPMGWLACNGQLLNIAQYQALYSLIGNTYGGDGRTTFALPDLRGRVPVGMPATPPANLNFGSGTASVTATGSVSLNIGVANLPAHNHNATFSGSAGSSGTTSVNVAIPALSTVASGTATNTPGSGTVLTAPGMPAAKIYNTANADTTLKPFSASGSVTIPAASGTVSVSNTGSGTPVMGAVTVPVTVATYQPSLYLNYIIAVEGYYPERP